ncbi:MAG: glycosyltransferase [Terriglobales bacterium]
MKYQVPSAKYQEAGRHHGTLGTSHLAPVNPFSAAADSFSGDPAGRPVRRWRVVHACDLVRHTADLAEAQLRLGMRPSILLPDGWAGLDRRHSERSEESVLPGTPHLPDAGRRGTSLVHTWQDVRRWRSDFTSERLDYFAEVLHAHCFAAAMAGLRGQTAVVYDLAEPIGESSGAGPWLVRSLRVAEQFVLSRADAVVVHSHVMWADALKRGARVDDLFLIPEPIEVEHETRDSQLETHSRLAPRGSGLVLLATDLPHSLALEAFEILASELENARLMIEATPEEAPRILLEARKRNVAEQLEIVSPRERDRTLAVADIVIAGRPLENASGPDGAPHLPGIDRCGSQNSELGTRNSQGPSETLRQAFAQGRAVLAADVPQNREVTPQGRGCLWFKEQDARDLAHRASFLARNLDFRRALAAAARDHIQATCSPLVVAGKYDEVYRRAYQRRRDNGPDALRQLRAIRVAM